MFRKTHLIATRACVKQGPTDTGGVNLLSMSIKRPPHVAGLYNQSSHREAAQRMALPADPTQSAAQIQDDAERCALKALWVQFDFKMSTLLACNVDELLRRHRSRCRCQ